MKWICVTKENDVCLYVRTWQSCMWLMKPMDSSKPEQTWSIDVLQKPSHIDKTKLYRFKSPLNCVMNGSGRKLPEWNVAFYGSRLFIKQSIPLEFMCLKIWSARIQTKYRTPYRMCWNESYLRLFRCDRFNERRLIVPLFKWKRWNYSYEFKRFICLTLTITLERPPNVHVYAIKVRVGSRCFSSFLVFVTVIFP